MGIRSLLGHKTLLTFVILYSCLITWASLAKFIFNPIGFRVDGGDKIAHFLAYFIFTVVWFLFFLFSERFSKGYGWCLLIASIICFLYGMLMEVLQGVLTNYRSPEWNDVVANTSGIIFAVFIFKFTENKLIRFRNKI